MDDTSETETSMSMTDHGGVLLKSYFFNHVLFVIHKIHTQK